MMEWVLGMSNFLLLVWMMEWAYGTSNFLSLKYLVLATELLVSLKFDLDLKIRLQPLVAELGLSPGVSTAYAYHLLRD